MAPLYSHNHGFPINCGVILRSTFALSFFQHERHYVPAQPVGEDPNKESASNSLKKHDGYLGRRKRREEKEKVWRLFSVRLLQLLSNRLSADMNDVDSHDWAEKKENKS